MGLPAGLLIFVGFLSLGASFILQLVVTLSVVVIKGLYFLRVDTSVETGTTVRLIFGVFNQCATPLGVDSGSICSAAGLGYKNATPAISGLQQILSQYFFKDLPYALVLQPISTGFTALAAGAAFLHLCTNTVLWPLSAIWATLLTASALAIELALFILARNRFNEFFAQSNSGNSAMLGPALWIQVAALPPAFFGFLMLAAGWWLKRNRSDNYYDRDYEPSRHPSYREKDDYYYAAPAAPVRAPSRQTRRSHYDDDYYDYEDSKVYGNVGRRVSRRESARSNDRAYDRRSYEDRTYRKSYLHERDPYGSRASLAPAPNAPYRGGRSRRYSERGAY